MTLVHTLLALALLSQSVACAAMSNGPKKIFLHMSEAEAKDTKFWVDGTPASWSMEEFSRSEVSRGETMVTYSVMSVPAIVISDEPPAYSTLAIENPRFGHRDVLLRRDLMDGYKFLLWLDGYLTVGIGTLVDVLYPNGLYGNFYVNVSQFSSDPSASN